MGGFACDFIANDKVLELLDPVACAQLDDEIKQELTAEEYTAVNKRLADLKIQHSYRKPPIKFSEEKDNTETQVKAEDSPKNKHTPMM